MFKPPCNFLLPSILILSLYSSFLPFLHKLLCSFFTSFVLTIPPNFLSYLSFLHFCLISFFLLSFPSPLSSSNFTHLGFLPFRPPFFLLSPPFLSSFFVYLFMSSHTAFLISFPPPFLSYVLLCFLSVCPLSFHTPTILFVPLPFLVSIVLPSSCAPAASCPQTCGVMNGGVVPQPAAGRRCAAALKTLRSL